MIGTRLKDILSLYTEFQVLSSTVLGITKVKLRVMKVELRVSKVECGLQKSSCELQN